MYATLYAEPHYCLVCLEESERYIMVQLGSIKHGFSICKDIPCVLEFRMWLRSDALVLGSIPWE